MIGGEADYLDVVQAVLLTNDDVAALETSNDPDGELKKKLLRLLEQLNNAIGAKMYDEIPLHELFYPEPIRYLEQVSANLSFLYEKIRLFLKRLNISND